MSEREMQQGDDETGVCHVCGQSFATQQELSKHLMDTHHEETLADPDGARHEG